ncbi:CDGSH iron-sulfur domain-containing protein 2 homolog A-like [Saccoglossus kowalevskii]
MACLHNHSIRQDWALLGPLFGTVLAIAYFYASYRAKKGQKDTRVNRRIQKDVPKVVNMVDIEDIGEKVSYCRCWKSKKFPYCDGSHNKHNEDCQDNVGPIVLKRKEV